MTTRVPADTYARRLETVRDRIATTDADAGVWFDATSTAYLTGFHHVPTERPVVLAVSDERVLLVVPRLERERAEQVDQVDSVHTYFDYPGGAPIETVVDALRNRDIERVAADADGAPERMGYEGPPLSAFLAVEEQSWVRDLRRHKSDVERDLLRESARWGNLAHRYLVDRIEPGAHPTTVSESATTAASRAMLDAMGERYVPRSRGEGPVHAGLISGPQTALPHGHTANRRLETGDTIITGVLASVDGYGAELERTMFVGEPSEEDAHYFELVREAQDLAVETLAPGVEAAAVAETVTDYFEEQGVMDLVQHHHGHAIGMDLHEPPYLDQGSDAVIEAGDVYAIEPALYTEEAGYRHSDTVAVTEDGVEWLTYFPRDLASSTVRCDT